MVVGDVNSTMACTLVCAKMGIRVAHIEAGLRSFDRTMPEEINRLVTDALADLLLTPSEDANANLLREGVAAEKIKFVGNIMIDSLMDNLPKARSSGTLDELKARARPIRLCHPASAGQRGRPGQSGDPDGRPGEAVAAPARRLPRPPAHAQDADGIRADAPVRQTGCSCSNPSAIMPRSA